VAEGSARLGLVVDDGQESKSTVAAGAVEDNYIVTALQQRRPIGTGGFHDKQTIQESAQMGIGQDERRRSASASEPAHLADPACRVRRERSSQCSVDSSCSSGCAGRSIDDGSGRSAGAGRQPRLDRSGGLGTTSERSVCAAEKNPL